MSKGDVYCWVRLCEAKEIEGERVQRITVTPPPGLGVGRFHLFLREGEEKEVRLPTKEQIEDSTRAVAEIRKMSAHQREEER